MILQIKNSNKSSAAFPEQNQFVFLLYEGMRDSGENKIGAYNFHLHRVGDVAGSHWNRKMLTRMLSQGKPILSKVVLANEKHKMILIDAQVIDFYERNIVPKTELHTFFLN